MNTIVAVVTIAVLGVALIFTILMNFMLTNSIIELNKKPEDKAVIRNDANLYRPIDDKFITPTDESSK